MFPLNLPIDGEVANLFVMKFGKWQNTTDFSHAILLRTCCRLVVNVADLLANSGEVTNLLQTYYQKTGVMDLGHNQSSRFHYKSTK